MLDPKTNFLSTYLKNILRQHPYLTHITYTYDLYHSPATNITYLLVSLFILYVGIILYVDGDYLYNKVKDFTLRRCELKL